MIMTSLGKTAALPTIRRSMRLIAVFTFMLLYMHNFAHADNSKKTDNLRATYWEDMASDTSLSFDKRISGIDSLVKHGHHYSPQLIRHKAKLLSSQLMYAKSAATYDELWKMSADMPIDQKIDILSEWIVALGMAGNMSSAAKKSIMLLRLEKPDSLKIIESDAYVSLAFSKIELGMTNKAKQELESARRVFENYKQYASYTRRRDIEIALIRAEVSLLSIQGKHREALSAIKKAYELTDDKLTIMNLDGYLADIYLDAKDYEAAERYYRKILGTDYSYHNRAVAVCNYMSMLIDCKRYDEALKVLDDNISRIPFQVNDIVTSNLIANKAGALAGLGDYHQAYSLMLQSKQMRDSINTAFLSGDHLAIYELEQEATQKDLALRQADRFRVWFWIAIAVLLLVCVCTTWLALKWHNEKQINRSNASRLASVDNDHRNQMNIKEDKISLQSRELTVHALKLAQVNELANDILAMTDDKSESAASRLKNIQDRIRQHDIQYNMWDVFKTYFEQTHPDFFTKLYQLHPDLSPNEVRVCAYIMLNLTTKEIASLTNRSSRTIETVKYRLHKKLGLDDESTVAYLNRIKSTYTTLKKD